MDSHTLTTFISWSSSRFSQWSAKNLLMLLAEGREKELFWNMPDYSIVLNRVCPQERLLKSLTSWGKNTIQLEHPLAILSHLKGEKTWEAPVGFTVQRPRITQHWDPKATPSISHHQISAGLFTQTLYPVITPGYQEKKIYEQLQEPQQTLEPDSDTVKVLVTQLC